MLSRFDFQFGEFSTLNPEFCWHEKQPPMIDFQFRNECCFVSTNINSKYMTMNKTTLELVK